MEKLKHKALTFDDVLLLPRYSDFLPSEADIESHLTKSITLKPQKRNISLEFIWSKNLKTGDLGSYIEISKNSFNTKSPLNISWIFSYKEKF